jgi:hypothetical protein
MLAFIRAQALLAGYAALYGSRFRMGALGLCALVSACAPRPELPAAADPASPVAATGYRPALSGYDGARPVEPTSWRERNDAVAPKEKAQ